MLLLFFYFNLNLDVSTGTSLIGNIYFLTPSSAANIIISQTIDAARSDIESREHQFDYAFKELDFMENVVIDIVEKMKEEAVAASNNSIVMSSTRDLQASGRNRQFKNAKDKEVDAWRRSFLTKDLIDDVKEYRGEFEKKRLLAEASLRGAVQSQASLLRVMGDAIIEDILFEVSEEINNNIDNYAEKIFKVI
jgi:hypothetical protein